MNEKPALIYVFDPLCGWCYGFSSTIIKIFNEYKDKLEFEVISGGMITGDRVGPLKEKAPYIKEAYKVVEQRTGVKFGEKYVNDVLEKGDAIQDSLPGSQLMAAFKDLKPEKALLFAADLQKAIYSEGVHPDDYEGLVNAMDDYGLDKEKFVDIAQSENSKQRALQEFELSSRLGVRGFPTVFIMNDNQLKTIANGAENYSNVKSKIDEILQ